MMSVLLLALLLGGNTYAMSCNNIGKAHDFKSFEPQKLEDGTEHPDGLVASSKEIPLTTENLLEAYKNGVFPWNSDATGQIGWYSPKGHGVIPLKNLVVRGEKLEKKLRKAWNKAQREGWTITFNKAFDRVVEECARAKRKSTHVWLVDEVQKAFSKLHKEGHAISVEVWDRDGNLIGGNYGIYRGGVFSGESLFGHQYINGEWVRVNDSSKVGLIALYKRLYAFGHTYVDTQVSNNSTRTLYGAIDVERSEYSQWVKKEAELTQGGIKPAVLFPKDFIWKPGEENAWMPPEAKSTEN